MLQSLVGEAHVHVHVALAAREGTRDLQALGLHCREPHLKKQKQHAFTNLELLRAQSDVCVHSLLLGVRIPRW